MKARSAALGAAVALSIASTAEAHQVGLSRGTWAPSGATVDAELTFARAEVLLLAPEIDADHDAAIGAAEAERAGRLLQRALVERMSVRADGAPCKGAVGSTRLAEEDGFAVDARFQCPAPPRRIEIGLPVLADLAYGHRHVAHVATTPPIDDVLSHRRPSIEVDVAAPADAAPPPSRSTSSIAGSFFAQGVGHILTGIDHLAFLFGTILLGGRLRAILAMVTAFTIAHSVTLALAVLGIWAPSAGFVEPAIALSVAYVGVENWFLKDPEKRWRITFPFGLLHGFGFASALGAIGLPRPQVPVALVTFNLGVEAGQVAVLAVLLPLVLWARKRDAFRTTGVRVLSAVVAVAGLGWFVARVAA